MKKIICILLSLAMMIGMTMPAYAESGLKVTTAISTDKTVYEPGEDIDVSLVLSNEGDKNAVATVEFSTTNFVSADMKSDEIVVRADSSTTRKYGASASYFEYDSGMGFQKAMDVVISFFVTSFYRMVAFFSSEKECVKIKIDNISAVIIVKTTVEEATEDEVELPSTQNSSLSLYNRAVKLVSTSKPGYTKHRASTLNNYEASIALTAFKSVVLKFIGAGAENEYKATVTKGKVTGVENNGSDTNYAPLGISTLTDADIKSATHTKSGNNYIITINVKDGSSSIDAGNNAENNSPLDKCGICVGKTDRSEFDHKIAEGIYDAIKDTAASTVVDEKTTNCKIVATVNASTNKLSNLVVTFTTEVRLEKCLGSKAEIGCSTNVTYSDFEW